MFWFRVDLEYSDVSDRIFFSRNVKQRSFVLYSSGKLKYILPFLNLDYHTTLAV